MTVGTDATESRTLNWLDDMKPSQFEPVPGYVEEGTASRCVS